MSAIAILYFGGASELFHQMILLAQQGRLDHQTHASQEPRKADMAPPDLDPMVNQYTPPLCTMSQLESSSH